MKRIRRITALLLALLMLLPSFTALAEGAEPDAAEPVQTETAAAPLAESAPSDEPVAEEPPASEGEETPAPLPEEPPVQTDEPTQEPTQEPQQEPQQPEAVAVTGVAVSSKDELTAITVGETLQLTAAVSPAEATDQSVTWSTSDEAVATVDETGLVTALAVGEALITAASANGVSGGLTLTVQPLAETAETETYLADPPFTTWEDLCGYTYTEGTPQTITLNDDYSYSGVSKVLTVKSGVTFLLEHSLAIGVGSSSTEVALIIVEDGGKIEIANGGELLISLNTANSVTTVDVQAGGSIYVREGGKLTLQNKGKIYVNADGELSADTGAIITNNGIVNDAVNVFNAAALTAALAAAPTVGDRFVQRTVYVDETVTLAASATVPAGMILRTNAELIVPVRKSLTVANGGGLEVWVDGFTVQKGGTLDVQSGGRMVTSNVIVTIATGAILKNAGHIEINVGGAPQLMNALSLALPGDVHISSIGRSTTLTGNATVRSGVTLEVEKDPNDETIPGEIVIPDGKTLTVAAGAVLKNNGKITVKDGGTLRIVEGGEYIRGDGALLDVQEGGTFENGGSLSIIVNNATALHNALIDETLASGTVLTLGADIALTGDETIPDGITVNVPNGKTLTVAADKALTVEAGGRLVAETGGTVLIEFNGGTGASGNLFVLHDDDAGADDWAVSIAGTLDNGGYVQNNGRFKVAGTLELWGPMMNGEDGVTVITTRATVEQHAPNGKFLDYGTLTDLSGMVQRSEAQVGTGTQADLEAALGLWYVDTVVVQGNPLNITSNLTVSGKTIEVESGLTVKNGATLTFNSSAKLNILNPTDSDDVRLTVEAGATLAFNSGCDLTLAAPMVNNGTVVLDGTVRQATIHGTFENNGTISGDNKGAVILTVMTADFVLLFQTYFNNPLVKTVLIDGDGDFAQIIGNMSIPAGKTVVVKSGNKLTVCPGARLIVEQGGALTVENGGTLELSGWESRPGGIVENRGTVTIGATANFNDFGAFYSVPGSTLNDPGNHVDAVNYTTANAATVAALISAVANGVTEITVTGNIVVPAATALELNAGTKLVVPAGKKLTVSNGAYLLFKQGCRVEVNGVVDNAGRITLGAGMDMNVTGVWNNKGTGELLFAGAGTQVVYVLGGVFVNDGTIGNVENAFGAHGCVRIYAVTGGAGGTFTNRGSMYVFELIVSGGSTLTNACDRLNGQSLTVEEHCVVSDYGTIENVDNAALVINGGNYSRALTLSGGGQLIVGSGSLCTFAGPVELTRDDNNGPGYLSVENGATLTITRDGSIANGGSIKIAERATVNQMGTYNERPEGERYDPAGHLQAAAYVTDDAGLAEALADTRIKDIVIGDNADFVPNGNYYDEGKGNIIVAPGRTLTVDAGAALTLQSSCRVKTLRDEDNPDNSGRFIIKGQLVIGSYGALQNYGITEIAEYDASFNLGKVYCAAGTVALYGPVYNRGRFEINTEADVRQYSQDTDDGVIHNGGRFYNIGSGYIDGPQASAIQEANVMAGNFSKLTDWRVETVTLTEDYTLTSTISIPEGKTVTIIPRKTLTCGSNAINVSMGGTLQIDGTVNCGGGLNNNGGMVAVCGQLIANGSTVYNTGDIEVLPGGVMEIRENYSELNMNSGSLWVADQAELNFGSGSTFIIGPDSRTVIYGEVNFPENEADVTLIYSPQDAPFGKFILFDGAVVTNAPEGLITELRTMVTTLKELKTALAGNDAQEIYIANSFALTENLTIPADKSVWVTTGNTFTINAGKKLTIENAARFLIDPREGAEGAVLKNNGVIENNGEFIVMGLFENAGALTSGMDAYMRLETYQGGDGMHCGRIVNTGNILVNYFDAAGGNADYREGEVTNAGNAQFTIRNVANFDTGSALRFTDSAALIIGLEGSEGGGLYIAPGANAYFSDSASAILRENCWLENDGVIEVLGDEVTWDFAGDFMSPGAITGAGTSKDELESLVNKTLVTTYEEFAAAVAQDARGRVVQLGADIEKPTGGGSVLAVYKTVLVPGEHTLTVTDGALEFRPGGALVLDSYYGEEAGDGGKLVIGAGGAVSTEPQSGETAPAYVDIREGARIENAGGFTNVGYICVNPDAEILNTGSWYESGVMELNGGVFTVGDVENMNTTAKVEVDGFIQGYNGARIDLRGMNDSTRVNVFEVKGQGGILLDGERAPEGGRPVIQLGNYAKLQLKGSARIELAAADITREGNNTQIQLDSEECALALVVGTGADVQRVPENQLTYIYRAADGSSVINALTDPRYDGCRSREVFVEGGDGGVVTLAQNATVLAGWTMYVQPMYREDAVTGTLLRIEYGATLTNEGKIVVEAVAADGGFYLAAESELQIAGELINNGAIDVYGRLMLAGAGSYSGLAAVACKQPDANLYGTIDEAIRQQKQDIAVEGVTVKQALNLTVLPNKDGDYVLPFTAEITPANAANQAVAWSVVGGAASINEDGVLTVSCSPGEDTRITVTATSIDDNSKFDEYNFLLLGQASTPALAVSYDGDTDDHTTPIELRSGQRVELVPALYFGEAPAFGITFEITSGAQYASVTKEWDAEQGKTVYYLNAKAVTEATQPDAIKIKAKADTDIGLTYESAKRDITVLPAITGAAITDSNRADITSLTQPLNLYEYKYEVENYDSVQFTAVCKPQDSVPADFQWTLTENPYFEILSGSDAGQMVTLVAKDYDANTVKLANMTLSVTVRALGVTKTVQCTLKPFRGAMGIDIVNKDHSLIPVEDLPVKITAGKSYEFAAKVFRGPNYEPSYKEKIAWSLRPEDAPFATVSGAGKVTAKPTVLTKTTVFLTATATDGTGRSATVAIEIAPKATGVFTDAGNSATGNYFPEPYTTVYVPNALTEPAEACILTAITMPDDAGDAVSWSPLGENRYATVRIIGADPVNYPNDGIEYPDNDGDLLITPKAGASGSFALTVKANDGSNKSERITVKVGSFIENVSFTGYDPNDPDDFVTAGEKRQLGYTLTPENPSSAAVAWSIDPAYKAYATITARGLLTVTPKVLSEMTIPVLLVAKDRNVYWALPVAVKPANTLVLHNETNNGFVTGTTQFIDIEGSQNTVTLSAQKARGDLAGDLTDVKWSLREGTANAYVDVVYGTGNNLITLTGKKAGSVTLNVTAKIGGAAKTATVKVTVRDPITFIAIGTPLASPTEMPPFDFVASGSSLQLSATAYRASDPAQEHPINATRLVDWAVYNERHNLTTAATISATGRLTATKGLLAPETVWVEAKPKDGGELVPVSLSIMVYPAATGVAIKSNMPVPDTNCTGGTLVIDRNAVVGQWPSLQANVVPNDAQGANQLVIWKSSNPKLITVDALSGMLDKGVNFAKGGTAVITATTLDGTKKAATVKLQVSELVSTLTIQAPANAGKTSSGDLVVASGKTLKLTPDFGTGNPTNKKVQWELRDGSDRLAASISAAGVLKGLKVDQPTKVTVCCWALDGSPVWAELPVYVYPPTTAIGIRSANTGEVLTGKTILLDLMPEGSRVTLDLECFAAPDGALPNNNPCAFSVTTKNTIVTCTPNGDHYTLTAMGAGKTPVTFTALDGSGKKATVTVQVGKLAQAVTVGGAVEVARGKGISLTAACWHRDSADADWEWLPKTKVKWTIDSATTDVRNYTVSTAGKLTAKLTAPAGSEVVVRATATDGSGAYKLFKVRVTEPATGVRILERGVDQTGKTVEVVKTEGTALGALVQPVGEVSQGVTWKVNLPAAQLYISGSSAFVDMSSVPLGRIVTVTATTTDGSAKTATIKLKCVEN